MATPMVLASLTVFALVSSVLTCGVPSEQWCSNEEVAKKCGVYEQCLMNDWAIQAPDIKPVNVVLCFESMCPDCQDYWKEQLYPVYQKVASIMHVFFVPYGNTREKQVGDHWEFDCQHGVEECIGNMMETCGGLYINKTDTYMAWVHCIETSDILPRKAAVECAKKFPDVPMDKIAKCSNSTEGNKQEHKMAISTFELCPNHRYVPWVMIDGKQSKEAEDNLLKVVCEAYTGPKPPACK